MLSHNDVWHGGNKRFDAVTVKLEIPPSYLQDLGACGSDWSEPLLDMLTFFIVSFWLTDLGTLALWSVL